MQSERLNAQNWKYREGGNKNGCQISYKASAWRLLHKVTHILPNYILAWDSWVYFPQAKLELVEEFVFLFLDSLSSKHLDKFLLNQLSGRLSFKHEYNNALIFILISLLCLFPVFKSPFKLLTIESAPLYLPPIALESWSDPDKLSLTWSEWLLLEFLNLGTVSLNFAPVLLDFVYLSECIARDNFCVLLVSEAKVEQLFNFLWGLLSAHLRVYACDDKWVVRNKAINEHAWRVELEFAHLRAETEQQQVGKHCVDAHQTDCDPSSRLACHEVGQSHSV